MPNERTGGPQGRTTLTANARTTTTHTVMRAAVKTHLTHLYAKLGVNDRAAAVAVAYERKILG
jgi:ATP/maltotriose-dependent transcriptional regulator MalT